MPLLVGAASNSATGYTLDNSLRFRASANAYLSRTPSSAGNKKTWTFSCWTKRGALTGSQVIFGAANSANSQFVDVTINGNNVFELDILDSNSTRTIRTSTAVLRDPSAWYHIALVIDTTQATDTNRIKLYVNNELLTTSAGTGTFPNQNADTQINATTGIHAIARRQGSADRYYDAYLTEIHHIDGQALAPTDFGEYNEDTGVWQPKRYRGSYGTNGFYLKGRGTDNSGNGNNFTENNLNTTNSALTTYDIMSDVPTLTDEDTSNFATLNPLVPSGSVTIDKANLKATSGTNAQRSNVSTISVSSGKYYWETTWNTVGANDAAMTGIIGVDNLNPNSNFGGTNSYVYVQDGGKQGAGSYTGSYGDRYVAGDVIGTALDLDANTITFYRNGTTQGTAFTSLPSVEYYLGCSFYNSGDNFDINFGQRPFAYTPPTGYKKLNTFNLPDSTIVDGSKHFDTTLYTGNGSTQSITGLEFQPDFLWLKARTGGSYSHHLVDAVRGNNKFMMCNRTDAEKTSTDQVTAFTSDGFTLGADSAGPNDREVNENTRPMVGWSWKANGTGVSNTLGAITSTVSANTTAGFSIVTWTKNGGSGARTIGHGLGGVPELVFFKEVDDPSNWSTYVGVTGNPAQDYWYLNLSVALPSPDSNQWSNTAPTSTLFTYNQTYSFGSNSSAKMIGYFFRSIEGYSKIGTYTGNGSTDGTFIYTGFRPAFVMIKRIDSSANWYIYDATRGTTNAVIPFLNPNNSDAEQFFGAYDFLSNGFKNRQTNVFFNDNNGKYFYMAFAENPFKNSLAR